MNRMETETQEQALIEILKDRNMLRQTVDYDRAMRKVNAISVRDLSFIHIQELTFENESPQREAVENVISALRLDGIRFIYFLLGDKCGVSFYFGIVRDSAFDDLSLDVDDIAERILKLNIEANFRGSKTRKVDLHEHKSLLGRIQSARRFARMNGVPGVFEDNENFQGIDRLVDAMLGDEFGLMIIADPLSHAEVREIEHALHDIYNRLAPLAKYTVQHSESETRTEGKTVTKSDSYAVNTSSSTSEGESDGTSTSVTKGKSSGNSSGSTSESSQEGSNKGRTKGKTETEGKSKTHGSSESDNESTARSTGENISREYQSKLVAEWLSYIDETLIKRLDYGCNKGIFHVGTYLFADQKGTLIKLGNTMQALFSGGDKNKAPLEYEWVRDENELAMVKNLQLPKAQIEFADNAVLARVLCSKHSRSITNWMSVRELSVMAALPKKEVVGLALREEVEFGLNRGQDGENADARVLLGNLVKSGNVLNVEAHISRENLNKHTFVCGVTGSGKTTTCQRLIDSARAPFMVIEPAKTEYRVLTEKYDDITIFTPGNEKVAPFRLNPFEFFEGENISSRVDMIKANIEAAFDMEAAIPQIIEAALYRCYEDYDWDIATSTNSRFENPFADGVYAFPTLSDLIRKTEVIAGEQGFDERLRNDYIGSIRARLQGLIVGAKGFMLDTPRGIDFRDLVQRNVIIELEEIKSGAEKSLLMGFILINLNEAVKIKHREDQGFRHITLIEEAHRLLSRYEPGDSSSKKLGVESFADMLAEVRKYGESLIIVDQIPNKLTPEVLKNTNTKIVHRLFARDDKEAIGNAMALTDEQKDFLSNLEVGRAIVSSQEFPRPVQVQVRQLEDVSTSGRPLVDEARIRRTALAYYRQHYRSGIIFGLDVYESAPEFATVEQYLTLPFQRMEAKWKELCKEGKTRDVEFTVDIAPTVKLFEIRGRLETLAEYLYLRFYRFVEGAADSGQILLFLRDTLEGKRAFTREEKARFTIRYGRGKS